MRLVLSSISRRLAPVLATTIVGLLFTAEGSLAPLGSANATEASHAGAEVSTNVAKTSTASVRDGKTWHGVPSGRQAELTKPELQQPTEAQANPNPQQLLSAICDPSDIEGANCKVAKDYPGGERCNVEISGEPQSGRFIAGTTLALVPYQSDCEPHANNWGGLLVFEESPTGLRFADYVPGVTLDSECLILPVRDREDELYCITGYSAQGYIESTLSRVVLVRNFSGEYTATYDVKLTATDSMDGASSAQVVKCSSENEYFSLGSLKSGPAAETLSLEIEACRLGATAPPDTIAQPFEGKAILDSNLRVKSRYVFDTRSGTLTLEAQFKVRPAPIATGRRVALVVGNSGYMHVGKLKNPKNDAELMARTLQQIGFTVTTLIDADQYAMKAAMAKFGRQLRKDIDASVFYYAGHGVQVEGENYLIPIDANIEVEEEVDFKAVSLNDYLRVMEASKKPVNIVVLDACRNNPFARAFRSQVRGLATVIAPSGTYVAYSTAPGTVAADGVGENSEYTKALAEAMVTPGLKLEDVFKLARRKVVDISNSRQVPWDASSLSGDFYFWP